MARRTGWARVYNPGTTVHGDEEGRPIDIMFFVERLEGMLANGKKLPLTSSVVVDQAAALELIDELRHAVPEEVQSARRINAEGERILERAYQEAERIIARAQEQAAYLIDEQGLTRAAEAESRRSSRRRRTRARRPRQGADDYAATCCSGGGRSRASSARSSGASKPSESAGARGNRAGDEVEEPVEPVAG